MRVAILGGSFDPPHIGHSLLATQVVERVNVDQVWLMPCYQHPFRKNLSSVHHRVAMCKLLQTKNIRVSTYEVERKNISYTVDTLRELLLKYSKHEFFWIIGEDQFDPATKLFTKWKDWQDIIRDYRIIIFPRSFTPSLSDNVKATLNASKVPKSAILLQGENLIMTNISSTIIRERVRQNHSLRHFIPDEIENYIKQHDLYRR